MSAIDTSAQVRAWALAEIEAQCFGEDFGTDVGWDVLPGPGGQPVIAYRLMVSCRSPLLGQPPLFAVTPLLSPQPTAELVKNAVTESLRQLRSLAAELTRGSPPGPAGRAPANGGPKALP